MNWNETVPMWLPHDYIFGGALRDHLSCRHRPKDYDLLIEGSDKERWAIRELLEHGYTEKRTSHVPWIGSRGLSRWSRWRGNGMTLDLFRMAPDASVETVISSIDFTINTAYQERGGTIVVRDSAREDIEAKRLCINNESHGLAALVERLFAFERRGWKINPAVFPVICDLVGRYLQLDPYSLRYADSCRYVSERRREYGGTLKRMRVRRLYSDLCSLATYEQLLDLYTGDDSLALYARRKYQRRQRRARGWALLSKLFNYFGGQI